MVAQGPWELRFLTSTVGLAPFSELAVEFGQQPSQRLVLLLHPLEIHRGDDGLGVFQAAQQGLAVGVPYRLEQQSLVSIPLALQVGRGAASAQGLSESR